MENLQKESNTQIIQRCYGYFLEGNIPALLNEVTDDITWTVPGPVNVMPWAGLRTGKAGVGEFFKIVKDSTEFTKFEPREYIAQGDRVVTLGFFEGRSKKTGRMSKSNFAMAFTLRNGKVSSFEEYSDTAAAVEAYK